MDDYRPIDCADHERLEFAVLRRRTLHLRLKDGRHIEGLPLDVFTQDSAEWLRFRAIGGAEETLRLDRIGQISEQ